ncbi:MAG: CotH kinase family protein [Prevotella sp.]|nr:CotH kinase family protein [Prevotella sp.]
MKERVLPIVILLSLCQWCYAQVVINEIMQSNVDVVMDDLNEFPDSWVELYNTGNTAVNLQEYLIGNSDNVEEAWRLPYRMLPPRQYALVYCDKEATKWHTNFRLESGKGGSVYLFCGNAIVDQLNDIPKQPAPNVAYGRDIDGGNLWGYQRTPSPNASNDDGIADGILGEPIFSEEGRVVIGSTTIYLTLSIPDDAPQGTEIRYTTNGSEPTNTSIPYYGPINISNTRTIRAKLFCEGYLSPRSTTHSYIFFPRQMTLPVISMVTDDKFLNDSKIGIYVEGNYKSGKKNYSYNWRRPVNFEYFTQPGQPSVVNQLCETRIQGGASRDAQLKSQVVYANKRFGKKRLSYEFFPEQRPGQKDFKSIILRNAGNDFDYLYMRDAIIQRTMATHTDLDWQAWQPTIVYINGTYKGILNIRERSTADNIFTNYDHLEDIDMVENWDELKEGDTENYESFKKFYAEKGHTMAEYAQWMDCTEFINLMAMNLYYNNQDFPGNNIVMWRPRSKGGKWRFVAKDTDFGLGLYGSSATYKSIEWLYNPNFDYGRAWANKPEHTLLFRQMMEDENFKREFIDRTAIYMGDFMNEKGTREIWDPMYELIKTEYPNHRKLINQWWPNYNSELNSARQWLANRTNSFYQQLANYYKLGTPTPFTLNKDLADGDREKMLFTFNGVPLSQGIFDGKFFLGRSVTLEGKSLGDWEVKGWEVTINSSSGKKTQTIQTPTLTFYMPSCQSLSINAILGIASGITPMAQASWTWKREGDNIIIEGLSLTTKATLYDARGMVLRQAMPHEGKATLSLPPTPQLLILKVGDEQVKIIR